MRYRIALLFSALTLFACGQESADTPATEATVDSADTVYKNGKIYTVDADQAWAEAVAIKDGKFLVVGSNTDVEAVTGKETALIDLGGRMLLPGLIDVHMHAMGAAMGKANLYIQSPNDADAILAEIEAYASANPELPFIRGEAWNLGVFPNDSPEKGLLDEIVPDRPAYFYSQTGHSAWVNSKALELLGIDENSQQTQQMLWAVDPATNEPTGLIREYTMAALEQALEQTPVDRLMPAQKEVYKEFSEWGFTALKLAEGEPSWVEAANELDRRGELYIRLFPSWFNRAHNGAMTAEESRDVARRWREYETPRVYPRYVKMFFDGSPDSFTSLMIDDYVGRPGFKGTIHLPLEEFIEEFAYFDDLGLSMIVHVFGDGSSRELVTAFEAVRERNTDHSNLLHFSHSVITQPPEITRLSRIPNVCMDFLTLTYPHPAIRGSFVPPIGEARYQTFLNTRTAVESGIPFGFGTDWPASLEQVPNAFFQMQAYVTRSDPGNPDSGTLNPSQALTLEEVIYGFTQGGAECLGYDWPQRIGSIEVGKLADFIVTDRNIFEISTESLKDTKVDLTVVGGEVVYER